jgi:P-type E1-E2 ATPase
LRKLLPQRVKLMRDGNVALGSVEELVPGDIVVLEQGDNVPADCRLVEAFDVRVNNAAVTGESISLARDSSASDADELVSGRSILLAGTSLVSGQAKAVVFATGIHTEFGRIAHLTQATVAAVSPLRQELAPGSAG